MRFKESEKMRIRAYNLTFLALVLFVVPVAANAQADSERIKELQVKAAFLYNFVRFVDWPEERMPDNNEPIIVGIVSSEGINKAFDLIKNKKIKNKKIVVKEFKGLDKLEKSKEKDDPEWNQKIDAFKKCHILFFFDSPKKENLGQITEALSGSCVLTVGQTAGFLVDGGGNINFLLEDEKVRFEVNLITAKRNNIKIRSRLLKLAKRVIEEEAPKDTKD